MSALYSILTLVIIPIIRIETICINIYTLYELTVASYVHSLIQFLCVTGDVTFAKFE